MKHFHCPVNAWDCPYLRVKTKINGITEFCICTLDDPYHDCDDFYFMWKDCDPEDYTDEN